MCWDQIHSECLDTKYILVSVMTRDMYNQQASDQGGSADGFMSPMYVKLGV